MTNTDRLIHELQALTPENQAKVLQYVESLKSSSQPALRSLEGLLEEYQFHVTEDDIAQARREMWGSLPKEPA